MSASVGIEEEDMGWFDPAWLKLHRRVCDRYEEIAFRDHSENPDGEIDIQSVVAHVLQGELRLDPARAEAITAELYQSFLNFPMRSAIEDSLRKQNPAIPREGVDKIFAEVKSKFLDTQHEHVHFVYFVISYIICSADYGLTRGDYFMKICLNAIPEDSSFARSRKLTRRFSSFLEGEDRRMPT